MPYRSSVVLLAVALGVSAAEPRGLRPGVFAIRDARVVVAPGQVLPRATVVIRDGLIEAVGADVEPPLDALPIAGAGRTVYPAFLDAGAHWGIDANQRRSLAGPPSAEDFASEALAATKLDNRKGVTPEFATATALLADETVAEQWRKLGFAARLAAPDGGLIAGQSAVVALAGGSPREALLRTPVALHVSFRSAAGDGYPRSLMGNVAHVRQTLLDAQYDRMLRQRYEQSGRSGKRPPFDPALDALGPALAGQMPVVFDADRADEIVRALDFAAEFKLRPIVVGGRDAGKVVQRLKAGNVPVVLRLDFAEPNAEKEKEIPARVVAERRRHEAEELRTAKVLHDAGVKIAFASSGLPADRAWTKFRDNLRKVVAAGLPSDAALAALTTTPAELFGVAGQFGRIDKGRPAHLIIAEGDLDDPATQIAYTFVDGVKFEYETKPRDPKKAEKTEKPKPFEVPAVPAAAKGEQPTEIDADRVPKKRTGGTVLIRGATVLPVTGPAIPDADIWVRDGKIAHVGPKQNQPLPAHVIDATGMFAMPGIIDTHAHFGIAGGANEFSLSLVPEVRVADALNGEDAAIYRALGGGVTMARLLHGSANCVGGQDAVIKLKSGKLGTDLLVPGAPRGVKFALGENVKRGDGRFPNTRLGVEAVLIRAFTEAQEYRKRWDEYTSNPTGMPPRRDLRLEALADILSGTLHIHCHCYRADEILMLLRVADRFGVKVKSLQHVLEGYKVAPEIAAHGASCSVFADWWAYKVEAFDAIPFAAALLHEAGASVCIKSDSNELVRHLYQDAAKTIKYGGMSESEALKTITLNAAKQLGLDRRVGSIEVGKDADLAIFNGHPLNGFSRCEMTLVEGEIEFQRSEKLTPFAPAREVVAKPQAAAFGPIPRAPNGRYVLTNVVVHATDGRALKPTSLLIDNGRIAAFDADTAKGATVVDGGGAHVYPGLIDAGTVLGLYEIGSANETQDFRELGDFQPDLRASSGINPDSELIPVTRANGVLTVVTRPMGGFLAGQGVIVNLAGWTPKEMAVVDPFALHIDFPAETVYAVNDPNWPGFGRALAKKQRDEKIRRVKELLDQAVVYANARESGPDIPANPRLEALVPYARGEKPVIVQAYRKAEILEALKLADERKLKLILSGGLDAWKVTDELKKRDVPVILGPVMALPTEPHDPYDAPMACAAELHAAGVRFCIRSAGAMNARNLPYEAAMAVSYGLPPEEGLKAVTEYPAKILGIEKEFGSLDAGKRANLVLTTGDVLQPTTRVLALFVDGKPLEPTNKQTRLYERYRERLKESRR